MDRYIGWGMVIVGAILAWYGWQEKQSVGSKLKEAISGSPTDSALWMLIGGVVLIVAGLGWQARKFRR